MIFKKFKDVQAFVIDVDGVLTNEQFLVTETGQQLRQFDIKDGYTVKLAADLGYPMAVITGGNCPGVLKRLNDLGIQEVFTGVHEKEQVLVDWLHEKQIDPAYVLYMGDDIPDLPCLKHVGLPTCPNNASEEVKQVCRYISPRAGGQGAVRDVIEKVLKLQDKWPN